MTTIKHASDVEFFMEHAGYGYDPKTETPELGKLRGARALADAERAARKQGFYWVWLRDWEECSGCDCGECPCATKEPHETLGCILKNEFGEILASLWSICEPSREYRRVIEAELALEVLE